jgi:OOP family OmpA-OmpF porin
MIRQIAIMLMLSLCWGVVDAAAPKDKGAFVGGNLGVTVFEDDGLFNGLALDDSDSGFGVFGGYKFLKYFSVEARYTDFGTFTVEDFGIDVSVLSVHAVGIIPFGTSGWELFGQLGLGSADINVLGESTSETVGSAGIGVRYSFLENFSLGIGTNAYAYEETEPFFGTTYDLGVVITAISFEFRF